MCMFKVSHGPKAGKTVNDIMNEQSTASLGRFPNKNKADKNKKYVRRR